MILNSAVFKQFTSNLKDLGVLPKNMEYTKVGSLFWVNVYDSLESEVINQTVNSGFDKDLTTAIVKAMTERIERKAFTEGSDNKHPSCLTERSDGFAAYPTYEPNHKELARENALNEAIERFVWATWWDNIEVQYTNESISVTNDSELKEISDFLNETAKLVKIKSDLRVIRPDFKNFPDKEVIILIAELEDGGVVSGGACGSRKDSDTTLVRAASELARHLLAVEKMKKDNLPATSFYEERLKYFSTVAGQNCFSQRISHVGSEPVELPKLVTDSAVPNSFESVVYTHRCLFENQPPFVGGKLERLCI